MKRSRYFIAVSLLGFLCFGGISSYKVSGGSEADAREAVETVKRSLKAGKAEDIDGYLALFHFSDDAMRERRRLNVMHLWKLFDMNSYRLRVAEVAMSGDTALVDYVVDADLNDESGRHRTVRNRYIAGMVKRGKRWLLDDIDLQSNFLYHAAIGSELDDPMIKMVNSDNIAIAKKLGEISDKARRFARNGPVFTPAPAAALPRKHTGKNVLAKRAGNSDCGDAKRRYAAALRAWHSSGKKEKHSHSVAAAKKAYAECLRGGDTAGADRSAALSPGTASDKSGKTPRVERSAVSAGGLSGLQPFYRMWNAGRSDHFYTISRSEKENAQNSLGYIYEGIEAYIYADRHEGTVSLKRYWHEGKLDHFYSADPAENNIAVKRYGYKYEGIAGYLYPVQSSGTVPLYRFWSQKLGDHLYTTNRNDRFALSPYGMYRYEGVAGYVYPSDTESHKGKRESGEKNDCLKYKDEYAAALRGWHRSGKDESKRQNMLLAKKRYSRCMDRSGEFHTAPRHPGSADSGAAVLHEKHSGSDPVMRLNGRWRTMGLEGRDWDMEARFVQRDGALEVEARTFYRGAWRPWKGSGRIEGKVISFSYQVETGNDYGWVDGSAQFRLSEDGRSMSGLMKANSGIWGMPVTLFRTGN